MSLTERHTILYNPEVGCPVCNSQVTKEELQKQNRATWTCHTCHTSFFITTTPNAVQMIATEDLE